MDLGELKLKDLEQLRHLFGRTVSKKKKHIEDGGIRIVVLQRGWVAVGRFSQEGDECTLTNAAIIRTWGTTKGLPELVNGPIASKTILDKTDKPIRYNELTAVLSLDCEESKWASHLN